MYNLRYKDNVFLSTLFVIAIPVVIQNVLSIGLNMIDTIMVSSLGENAISAVGLANRIYFIFTTICFGTYSGASIFIAQYWGVKHKKNIRNRYSYRLHTVYFIFDCGFFLQNPNNEDIY